MNKRKYLLVLALSIVTLSLSGCGVQEEAGSDGGAAQEENNQIAENTSDGDNAGNVDYDEEVQQTPIETETNTIEDVAESEVEIEADVMEDAGELEKEIVSDEPEVEMVDFETWAKQEGNEEPCLVIWNERLGIQDIMPTFEETKEIYGMQSGDKFAVPYNEKIEDLRISEEVVKFDNTDYLEVLGHKGKLTQINITFKNEQGEYQTLNYLIM